MNLLLYLDYLIIPLLTFVFLLLPVIHFSGRKNVITAIEKPFTLFIFIFILSIYPFQIWHPQDLVIQKVEGLNPFSVSARLVVYGLILVIFRAWFRGTLKGVSFIFQDFCLTLLLLLSLLSTLWAQSPDVTLRSSLVFISLTLLSIQLARRYEWKEIFLFMRWSLAVVCILSLFASVALPSVGRLEGTWRGLLGSDKSLTSLMALSTVLWLWHGTAETRYLLRSAAIALLSFLMMVMGGAEGGYVTFATLGFLAIALRPIQSLPFRQASIAVIGFLITGILGSLLISANKLAILAAFGKDPSLTGRTGFWPQLLGRVSQHFWFGYGYSGFWQPWRGNDNPALGIALPNGYVPPHSHNGFLEVVLQLGVVGFCLFLVLLIRRIGMAILYMQSSRNSEVCLPLLLLSYLVIANAAESERLGLIGPTYMWIYFTIVGVRLTLDLRNRARLQRYAPA